ncbi:hypothetical protein SLA2020_077530 [Shorea laevis]
MSYILPVFYPDILLSLPVKSLLRFRCLSKSFCSQIDSPDFVKMHLQKSIATGSRRNLVFSCLEDLYISDFDTGLVEATRLSTPFAAPNMETTICGYCNGMILSTVGPLHEVRRRPLELVLWNPFCRKLKRLPVCPATTTPNHVTRNCSLGYDWVTDDYKVVLISDVSDVTSEVWVFSLKSNSWDMRQELPHDNGIDTFGSYSNGALYWELTVTKSFEISGFDLANEHFFRLPNICLSEDGQLRRDFSYLKMAVVDGYVHRLKLPFSPQVQEFYFYDTRNGGIGVGVWRKAFTFEQEEDDSALSCCLPLAYSKDGNAVLFRDGLDELFWYNLEMKTIRKVDFPAMPQNTCSGSFVCLETLVSPCYFDEMRDVDLELRLGI